MSAMSIINMCGCASSTSLYKKCARIFFLLEKCMHSVYADMAAARYSSNVLQMSYGPIPREEKINLPEPLKPDFTALFDRFQISQNNFQEWLRVWRMDISERNPNKKDLLKFTRENKRKITDLVGQETQRLNSNGALFRRRQTARFRKER